MRILITNDDGIHAEGLAVLERIAATLSDDVWVVAPETDQSGLAHSLTLNDPLRLRQVADRHFAVRGTPTDCVIMGLRQILDTPPDLVLSGINRGHNLADDLTYSGTVAAAMADPTAEDNGVNRLVALVAAGRWVPVELVIARPFVEHLMMSAVLAVAGRDTGATLFGPAGARRRLSGPCTHFPSPQRSHPSSRLRSQTCRSRRTRRSRRSRAT